VTELLPPLAHYPRLRLRRNRRDAWSRKPVAENLLTSGDLIWPVFVHDEDRKQPIASMPGVFRLPISALVDAAGEAAAAGHCDERESTQAGAPLFARSIPADRQGQHEGDDQVDEVLVAVAPVAKQTTH
jgi:Delta-aminolevulinic acid dehydratase